MTTQLNPYIHFKNNAKQAFEYYQSILGGKLEMHTFGEFNATEDETEKDKIMHGMLTLDSGEAIMGADTPNSMGYEGGLSGFSISLSGDSTEELRKIFSNFCQNGTVVMPLEKQMWGDEFGMVADQFGVNWMINIHDEQSN